MLKDGILISLLGLAGILGFFHFLLQLGQGVDILADYGHLLLRTSLLLLREWVGYACQKPGCTPVPTLQHTLDLRLHVLS